MVPVDSNGISPVPPYSGYPPPQKTCLYGAFTLYGALSQVLPVRFLQIVQALQPRSCRNMAGLGSSHFARHYSGNHYYFLFLRVLRCFSSPGSPPVLLRDNISSRYWVVPFGNLRINSYLRIPAAYRSLLRPSSPLRAKAFPIRPYLLSRMSFALTALSPFA